LKKTSEVYLLYKKVFKNLCSFYYIQAVKSKYYTIAFVPGIFMQVFHLPRQTTRTKNNHINSLSCQRPLWDVKGGGGDLPDRVDKKLASVDMTITGTLK
jgi:hypothetical protein